jgi:hypothetical protein
VLPTVLGFGGIWSSAVVPASRQTPLAVASLVLLVSLCVLGARRAATDDPRRLRVLGGLAVVGLALALLGAVPGTRTALAWAVSTVPGAGLLRDGSKFVALMVPLVAVLAASGATHLAARVRDRASATAVVLGLAVLPVALLPDLAWGAGGRLAPVQYPAAWAVVRQSVAAETAGGDLLLLPWSAFRRYRWNANRTVLDPALRFFPRDVVADDRLAVGRHVLAPEDPRSAAVGRAVAGGRLDAPFLRARGIRLVLLQTDQPGPATAPAGTVPVVRRAGLLLLRVPGQVRSVAPRVAGGGLGSAAVVVADLAAASLALGAVLWWAGRRLRRAPR